MTRIVMLQTRRGTEDGFTTRQFYKNTCYEVADCMAAAFIALGYAVYFTKYQAMEELCVA